MIKKGSKQYRQYLNIIENAKADIRKRALKHPNDVNTYGVQINLDKGTYKLTPIHNEHEFLKSIGNSKTHFDYRITAKSAQKAINNHDIKTLKEVIHLINCSLFKDEDGVDKAFEALSEVHCSSQSDIFKIVFRELLRLNIWSLISDGRKILKHNDKAGYIDYLEGIYINSTSSLRNEGNYLPEGLRLETKSALKGNYNRKLATIDIIKYLSKYHFIVAHKTLLFIYLRNIYQNLHPISNKLISYVKTNNLDMTRALLSEAKDYITKITYSSDNSLNKNFPSFSHSLIVDIPVSFANRQTADSILKSFGEFDLFLIKLYPLITVARRRPNQMRACLANIVRKDKYFHKIRIKLTLKKSVNDMTVPQVIIALRKFIHFMEDNENFILDSMVKKRIL